MTQRRQASVTLAVIALLLVVLAAGLRPDAFYVGDPGVKLLAAHHAVKTPWSPFRIPLPTIGSDPVPHVSPFFTVHDDHAHAVTSELFPLLTAPLLAVFGLRGLYVLPALGFLLALASCAWLGLLLDGRRSASLIIVAAAAGTPLLFYGLEFWEHAPAVAAGTAGTAFLIRAGLGRPARLSTGAIAGALFGLSMLLRPEAAWFALASCVASRALATPPSFKALGAAAVAAAVVLTPLALRTFLHFGTLVPAHLSSNAALLEDSWLAARAALTLRWLAPWPLADAAGSYDLWRSGPAALAALASAAWCVNAKERRFLWITAGLNVVLVVLSAPNDGGGQWGPRYLLFTYVPLAILGADGIARLYAPDTGTGRPGQAPVRVAILTLALFACLWVQRSAYRELRGAKNTYGRIVDFVRSVAPPGTTVITDIWWLDQIAAAPLRDHNVLFAGTDDDARGILARMSAQTSPPPVTLVRSREGGRSPEGWNEGTCYIDGGHEEIDTRSLTAIRLRVDCTAVAPAR